MSRTDTAARGLVAALAAASSMTCHAQLQTPQWSAAFTSETGASSHSISMSARDDGVVASLIRSAVRLDAHGLRQWKVDASPACTDTQTNARIHAVAALPDAGAWLLRGCYSSNGSSRHEELVRIGGDGSTLAVTDLGATPAGWDNARLVPRGDDLIVLVSYGDRVRWLRVGIDGILIEDAYIELARPHERVTFPRTRLWPNGSASVVLWQGPAGCLIDPPSACPRPATTLLRLNADGTERWRVEAGAFYAFVGFEEDGSSLIAEPSYGGVLKLRQVGANGVAGPTFIAADGEPMYLDGEAGPIRGRYYAYSDTERLLIDRNGQVLARAPVNGAAGGRPSASSTYGFITGSLHKDGALVSADDLSVLDELDLDGVDDTSWGSGYRFWHVLDDGAIITNVIGIRDVSPQPVRARLSRFAIPGTPAADLVFVDHFE